MTASLALLIVACLLCLLSFGIMRTNPKGADRITVAAFVVLVVALAGGWFGWFS